MKDSSLPSLFRPKILVVDDLYANRLSMRHVLTGLRVELIEADSGNAALAACLEHEFALILLDVQMPGMDGVEVAQLLNGEESTRDTPVIFVTAGSTDDMDRLKGYDVGAVDYITKPLNPPLLSAKVRNFLDLYESRRALKAALAALDERNLALQREIEERKNAEARAQQLATHDALTGLPNRLLFVDRLASSIQRARRNGTRFALGYMDLDGFKQVNDEYGHRAGDAVLQTIATRLQAHVRESDTVARFGGDEFALIFEAIHDENNCADFCTELRGQLSESVVVPLQDGEISVAVGVSIGLAIYPAHGASADRLMHNADCALYTVKRNGKAAVRVFRPEDDNGLVAVVGEQGVGKLSSPDFARRISRSRG
ncbi:diguanylate cyclase domain-containing protein [Salinisphaera aquimarina]|uniref:Diguanylate cyclase domain-containing protein n=1 Tax=Salinisphaera aquimarina TaxID=2094031 RepID=A0ABV7ES89_9GAMM